MKLILRPVLWRFFVFLLLGMTFSALSAQEIPVQVEQRAISEQQWEKAADDLDYSRDLPRQEASRQPQGDAGMPDMSPFMKSVGNIFQVLIIILAVAGIAYGIYRMAQQPRNRQIARDGAEITVDNLDAYIHETDLDRFLRDALAAKNYPLAIRLYFLQIIKDLSRTGAINWSKEKTNRDYLREMRGHQLAKPFRHSTHTFEWIWYGNATVSEADFARLEPEFKNLLRQIV